MLFVTVFIASLKFLIFFTIFLLLFVFDTFAVLAPLFPLDVNNFCPFEDTFPFLFVDCKQYNFTYTTQDVLEITKSIDNLKRFGLVVLNQDIIELGYDYDSFKSQEIIHALIDGLGEEGFFFKKYRLELSELGKDFIDTCIR